MTIEDNACDIRYSICCRLITSLNDIDTNVHINFYAFGQLRKNTVGLKEIRSTSTTTTTTYCLSLVSVVSLAYQSVLDGFFVFKSYGNTHRNRRQRRRVLIIAVSGRSYVDMRASVDLCVNMREQLNNNRQSVSG